MAITVLRSSCPDGGWANPGDDPLRNSWGRAPKAPEVPVPAYEAWRTSSTPMSSVSGASTPILPRVRSISAIPFVVPIDLYAFQAAVLNRYARRVTYPVHLVVSR